LLSGAPKIGGDLRLGATARSLLGPKKKRLDITVHSPAKPHKLAYIFKAKVTLARAFDSGFNRRTLVFRWMLASPRLHSEGGAVMSDLVVIEFPSEANAEEVRQKL
jgi:hypothetical protein